RSLLPPGTKMVGFLGRGDDPDISLWRPFGCRRVDHVLLSDSALQVRGRGIEYVVAGDYNFSLNGTTFDAWLQTIGGQLIAMTNITVRVSEGRQTWYIVKMSR